MEAPYVGGLTFLDRPTCPRTGHLILPVSLPARITLASCSSDQEAPHRGPVNASCALDPKIAFGNELSLHAIDEITDDLRQGAPLAVSYPVRNLPNAEQRRGAAAIVQRQT